MAFQVYKMAFRTFLAQLVSILRDISKEWSCCVTWQVKYISPPAKDVSTHNRQRADMVLEAPKHDPLTKWSTWGHMTVWKFYISIFMRFKANKLGRLLILGRIFIMQTLKPTSCLNYKMWKSRSNNLSKNV